MLALQHTYNVNGVIILLQARGCPLKGIAVTSDIAAHIRRFTDNGWQEADAKDMSTIYKFHLDPAEKRR